jgi:hypothetical protein
MNTRLKKRMLGGGGGPAAFEKWQMKFEKNRGQGSFFELLN